jgi:hypothetical protein
MWDIARRPRHTLSDMAVRLVWATRAFESRHRRLVDDLTAALVGLIAISVWSLAFALFAE